MFVANKHEQCDQLWLNYQQLWYKCTGAHCDNGRNFWRKRRISIRKHDIFNMRLSIIQQTTNIGFCSCCHGEGAPERAFVERENDLPWKGMHSINCTQRMKYSEKKSCEVKPDKTICAGLSASQKHSKFSDFKCRLRIFGIMVHKLWVGAFRLKYTHFFFFLYTIVSFSSRNLTKNAKAHDEDKNNNEILIQILVRFPSMLL